MRAGVVAISALLLAVAFLNVGLGLQSTLLGIRAGLEGFDLSAVGFIMSANFAGFVAGSILGANIVNNVGHIRAFAVFASVGSAAVLLHAVFVDPLAWIVFRAITGFSYAGMCMVVESWLNQRSGNADRGSILSLYMGASLAASTAGQLLLNLWSPGGFELFVLVSVIVSLALVPVALTTSPAPLLSKEPAMGIRALFAASPVGVIGCFATGLMYSAIGGIGAVFAQSIGMSTFEISIFMMLIVIGGTISLWPIGRLSDRFDRRWIIATLFFGVAALGAGVVFAAPGSNEVMLLYVLGTLYGAASLPLYGIVVAHANDKLANDQYVSASSSLLFCYGTGAMVGPLMASYAMISMGPSGLFASIGAVAAASAIFVLWRVTRRPMMIEEKVAFMPFPRTTPAVIALAPSPEAGGAVGSEETAQP